MGSGIARCNNFSHILGASKFLLEALCCSGSAQGVILLADVCTCMVSNTLVNFLTAVLLHPTSCKQAASLNFGAIHVC